MRSVRPFRLSPGTVIAAIALLVALSGTSYATVLQVPRNSVGTAQLKTNAVTSIKVRNGSLLRADFRSGQIPAGPTGPAGPAGTAGPAGAAGAAGPAGPSDAYARFLDGPVAIPASLTTLATLSIPQAGKYVVWAKTYITTTADSAVATCRLEAGQDVDQSLTSAGSGTPRVLSNMVAHEFAGAGSVDFRCLANGAMQANFVRIAAIRVANLTNTG